MKIIQLLVNVCNKSGADSKNRSEFWHGRKSNYLSPINNENVYILSMDFGPMATRRNKSNLHFLKN